MDGSSARPADTTMEPGIVAAGVYADGRRVSDIAIEEAGRWAKQEGHVVWIGLFEPSPELLRRVQVQLDLHPLAIEDAGKPHQRPKLEQYGDALFVVARTAPGCGRRHRLRRNPYLHWARLRRFRSSWRFDVVRRSPATVRGLPHRPRPR
jgi:Mg2+ and Co2+ transporter CorA